MTNNIELMLKEYKKEGYSEANADARVCQDIVLKAISFYIISPINLY